MSSNFLGYKTSIKILKGKVLCGAADATGCKENGNTNVQIERFGRFNDVKRMWMECQRSILGGKGLGST